MVHSYGIKAVLTTVRNPSSNGVVERVHLTMGNMLRTMTFRGADWFQDMQRALDAVAWAVRTTINPNIKHSPCHLAFNQDMIFRWAVAVQRNKGVSQSGFTNYLRKFASYRLILTVLLNWNYEPMLIPRAYEPMLMVCGLCSTTMLLLSHFSIRTSKFCQLRCSWRNIGFCVGLLVHILLCS